MLSVLFNLVFLCLLTMSIQSLCNKAITIKKLVYAFFTGMITSILLTFPFSWGNFAFYFLSYTAYSILWLKEEEHASWMAGLVPLFYYVLCYGLFHAQDWLITHSLSNQQLYLYSFCMILGSGVITLLFLLAYMKFSQRKMKDSFITFMMMLVFFPMYFIVEVICMHQVEITSLQPVGLLSIFGIFVANMMILFILYKMVSFSNTQSELIVSKQREESLQMKYDSMKQHYESQFHFIHHLLHQCNALHDDLQSEDYEALKEDLEQVTDEVFTQFNLLFTNSEMLNYVILEHMDTMKQEHIYMKSVIEYQDFSFLSLSEQLALFDSLLCFALDSVKQIEDNRMISFKTKKVNNQVLLQCSFTTNQEVNMQPCFHKLKELRTYENRKMHSSYDANLKLMKILVVFYVD